MIDSNFEIFCIDCEPPWVSSVSAAAASNQSRLFLVVDIYQIVLVEPDSKRLGWGVAIFAGFLQGNLYQTGIIRLSD